MDRWQGENVVRHSRHGCDKISDADLSLRQIAVLMGWSVRYAAQVIEHYAQVSPDESDVVLRKLNQAKSWSENMKM